MAANPMSAVAQERAKAAAEREADAPSVIADAVQAPHQANLPEGYVFLGSAAKRTGQEAYAAWHPFLGKMVVILSVQQDENGAVHATIQEFDGMQTVGEQVTALLPKAAVRMLDRAVKNAPGQAIVARVETSKRGIALR